MNLHVFQLNKRFVLNFLNVHGKLFTKIGYVLWLPKYQSNGASFGFLCCKITFPFVFLVTHFCFRMESFEEVSCQMLQEFSALIQHTPPPIGNNRLLQLMCINMYAVQNTEPKGEETTCQQM